MHHHLLIWRWRDKTARLDDKEGTGGETARKTDAEVADRMKLSVAGPEFQLSNNRLGLSVFYFAGWNPSLGLDSRKRRHADRTQEPMTSKMIDDLMPSSPSPSSPSSLFSVDSLFSERDDEDDVGGQQDPSLESSGNFALRNTQGSLPQNNDVDAPEGTGEKTENISSTCIPPIPGLYVFPSLLDPSIARKLPSVSIMIIESTSS